MPIYLLPFDSDLDDLFFRTNCLEQWHHAVADLSPYNVTFTSVCFGQCSVRAVPFVSPFI